MFIKKIHVYKKDTLLYKRYTIHVYKKDTRL